MNCNEVVLMLLIKDIKYFRYDKFQTHACFVNFSWFIVRVAFGRVLRPLEPDSWTTRLSSICSGFIDGENVISFGDKQDCMTNKNTLKGSKCVVNVRRVGV